MKILFTYKKVLSTFMRSDVDLLSKIGEVETFRFTEIKSIKHLAGFFNQLLYLILFRHDVYYCYFSDYHSVLPVLLAKLTGRKSVVIVAGYDCFNIKDQYMTYGVFTSAWRGWCAKIVYKYASHILPNSEALKSELSLFTKVDDRFKTVYFGFSGGFKPDKKENYCLTVGYCFDRTGYYRKGYDRLLLIASLMPDVKFIAVGMNFQIDPVPENVIILQESSPGEVAKLMSKAKVYLHPARIEGFGTVICEAMLSGCWLIASAVNGIKEIDPDMTIDQGVWLKSPQRVTQLIRMNFDEVAPCYSNMIRVRDHFKLETRFDELKKIL